MQDSTCFIFTVDHRATVYYQTPLPQSIPPLPLQGEYQVNLIGYNGAEVIAELHQPIADSTLTLSYIPELYVA